jgi:hypothetical protein
MAESHVLSALKRQYALALGFVEAGEDRAADLEHLAAVIGMFSPDEDLGAIRPIRPYRANRDRWLADALAVLRQCGEPMTPRALARRILSDRGVALTRAKLQPVEVSLHFCFERLEGRGLERMVGPPKRWRVQGSEPCDDLPLL